MMRSAARNILAMLCLYLAGCTVSHFPITAEGPPQPDDRLLGHWRATVSEDDLNPAQLTISRRPDGTLLVESISGEAASGTPERIEVVTARIAGTPYGSASSLDSPAKPGEPEFIVFRYEVESADRVQLHFAPMTLLQEAVADGELVGRKHDDDRHFDIFEITSDAAQLRAFVAAKGSQVFHLKGPLLERTDVPMKPATPRRR